VYIFAYIYFSIHTYVHINECILSCIHLHTIVGVSTTGV
jgi:hypothetical protein